MGRSVWRTIDFRPDSSGWRLHYVYPNTCRTELVVGWVIQEEAPAYKYRSPDWMPGSHRIIPGIFLGGQVVAADTSMCQVLAPGEPEPTAEEVAEHREAAYGSREFEQQEAAR